MSEHHGRFAMYSATRQWNPGDEFILAGSRRIIDTALGHFEPVLYDRNPDVRPSNGTTPAYRNLSRPVDEEAGALYERLSSHLRLGFFSNSVKFDSDMSFASLAIMAGSPEWATPRCWSFYDHILRNGLPFVGLGLGSMPPALPDFMHTALEHAALLTTRSRRLAESDLARRYAIEYLPCPALLSAPSGRQVNGVHRVAIAIGVPYAHSVWANGLDADFYQSVTSAIDELIARYGAEITFDFVIHYVDEIPIVRARFPEHTMRYSFDSGDYFGIFDDYDLVISTRVHACGIAASLGIPSISMGHDFRSDTTQGFLSTEVDPTSGPFALVEAFEQLAPRVAEVSASLAVHRTATLDAYVERVRDRFGDGMRTVDYGAPAPVVFTEAGSSELPEPTQIGSLIESLVDESKELQAARASNDQLRSTLIEVESSKAEIATELDGARAAVVRLEEALSETRATLEEQLARTAHGPLRRLVRKVLGR